MRIVTASNGKKTVKISKSEWQQIGKKAGWKIAGNWAIVQENNERINQKRQSVKNSIDYCKKVVLLNDVNFSEQAKSLINTLNATYEHFGQAYMSSGYAYDDNDPRNKMIDQDDDEAKYGDFGGDENKRINDAIQKEVAERICENELAKIDRIMKSTFGEKFSEQTGMETYDDWTAKFHEYMQDAAHDRDYDDQRD